MSRLVVIVVLAGAAVLAFDPLVWLIRSWHAPGYDGSGGFVFAAVLGLFLWSVSSRGSGHQPARLSVMLLVCSALIRLAAQLLAINVIGALTLAVDVFALGTVFGLSQRARPVAPFWLAVLFCFCLPLEAVVQRIAGFALQQVSAAGACGLLAVLRDDVACAGIRILIAGKDVLVDVPCSGSRVLMMTLMAFAALAALRQPDWPRATAGGVAALAAALFFNTVRIAVLAVGIVEDLPVMAAPWHELIGVVSIAGATLVMLVWASRIPAGRFAAGESGPGSLSGGSWLRQATTRLAGTPRLALPAAAAFMFAAVVIVSLEPEPVDVSGPVAVPGLPHYVAGFAARPVPLSTVEQDYFIRFGGAARRANYGPFGLLLVRTGSPLRHLHAPDVCLEGAGHAVEYLGTDFSGIPSAVYRSRDPTGQLWRVQVSFVSSTGQIASSVSEAVWHWLLDPDTVWTMVERISPWHLPAPRQEQWEAGVARAFNLS